MDGSLAMEAGEIYDLLELIGRNFDYDPNRQHRSRRTGAPGSGWCAASARSTTGWRR